MLNEIILNEEDDFDDDEDYIDDDEDYSEALENSRSQLSLKAPKQTGQNKQSLNFEHVNSM